MAKLAPTAVNARLIGNESFEELAKLIASKKQGNPLTPVTVVTPSLYTGLFVRRQISASSGLVNVNCITMPRLAVLLGSSHLSERGKSPLTPLMEMGCIRHVSTQSGSDGPLRAVSSHEGMPGLLSRVFTEFSYLEESTLSTLSQVDELRAQLVDWYQMFKQEAQQFYVTADLLRSADENVREGLMVSSLAEIGHLVFYLVNDFSNPELSLVKYLCEHNMASVVVGTVGETGIDEHSTQMAKMISPDFKPRDGDSQDIRTPMPVQLVSAPDAREEIRWVVRDIARRSEEGMSFNKMAILYRQSEPYSSLIASQLRLSGIPVAGPDPTPISHTPPGRALLNMLDAINSGLSRPEVLKWLSESPVKLDADQSNSDIPFSDWEFVSRSSGIVKGLSQWIDRLSNWSDRMARQIKAAEELEESSPAKIEGMRRIASSAESLQKFIVELGDISTLPDIQSWADLARWVKELLERYSVDEEEWPGGQAAIHFKLLQIVSEFEVLDDTKLAPALPAFLEILEQLLGMPSGPLGQFGEGVFIAPVPTVLGMSFDVVYLVGLCEGDYPTAPPQDSVLPFEVRESVGDALAQNSRDLYRLKERRDYLLADLSCGDLVLSYPRADSRSQRPTFPSPWFLDSLEALHGDAVSSDEIPRLANNDWLEVLQSPLHSLQSAAKVAPADIHDRDVAEISAWVASGNNLKDHYLAHPGSSLARSMQLYSARQSRSITEWDGDISRSTDRDHQLGSKSLSATGLESWCKCPFSYFLSHILGLRSLDSPEDVVSISPLDKGSLVHRILERAINQEIRSGRGRDGSKADVSEQMRLIRRLAEEEFERVEAQGITGKSLLWASVKEDIMRDLLAFAELDIAWREEHGFSPIWVEKSFGFSNEDSLDPLTIGLKNGLELSFRGMIDRVDISDDGKNVVVTDYKTGSSYSYRNMNDDPLDSGRKLQLPIYAMAAKHAMQGIEKAEGDYWFVSTAANFERKFVDLNEVEDRFIEVIEQVSLGIQSGLFPANPGPPGQYGPENCSFCDFNRICPTGRSYLWEQKNGDSRLGPYNSLKLPQQEEEL